MPNVNIPQCAGEHDKIDVICNGDPKGKTQDDKAPCGWRDSCVAFKAFLVGRGKTPEDYLDIDGDSVVAKKGNRRFAKMCAAQIREYGVENGEMTKKPVPPKRRRRKPTKRARLKSAKAVKALAVRRRKDLAVIFQHFKAHLIENLDGVKFVPPKGVVLSGHLYSIDRAETSGYIAIYCKQPGVMGAPIAQLNLRPRSVTYDIELPVDFTSYGGIGKRVMDKIRPHPIDDGRFRSICKGMDMEGAALVAQTIARMIGDGRIQL